MSKLPGPYQRLKKSHPKVFRAYEKLGETAAGSGPLDQKTRELIKLGMAAAMRGENAVHSHTQRALEAGASVAEIEHTLMLGVTTFGFPTMMSALTWAYEAIEAHTAA
jgi:4-carboxymuconolactone decarboxylase